MMEAGFHIDDQKSRAITRKKRNKMLLKYNKYYCNILLYLT